MSHVRTLIRLWLILLIVQSSSCGRQLSRRGKEEMCKSEECKTRGKEYKNNMDTRINPCQDFYTYACGNFHRNHVGPKYTSEWSMLNVMNLNTAQIIRKTLDSYKYKQGGNRLFRRAKEVYETCLKIPEYPIKKANDIVRELGKIGRIPKTPLWDIHFKYLELSGESAFFRTKVLSNKPSEDIPVLILMEPLSAYGIIFHEEAWKPQEEKAYTDFLFQMMKSLKLKDSDAEIREQIEKVFEFRLNLQLIILQNKRKTPDMFNPLTGKELDAWFSNTIEGQTRTQDIPWPDIIEALLHNLPQQTRRERKVIAMRRNRYFLDLMDLIKNVPEKVLANHMEIFFVERHLKLNEEMYKLLEATSVEPHGHLRYIRERFHPRWKTCIEEHNMKDALEKLLYHKWFQKESTKDIHEMIGNIKIAIDNQMKKSQWLDRETREKTMKKLSEMDEWIGFPPWLDGITSPRDVINMNKRDKKEILSANAWYTIEDNLLYIQAPLLLTPMYNLKLPAVYNYGAIGATLGHEMYHVVDNCGSYGGASSTTVWWPDTMRTKCQNNRFVFINAYNKITDREFKNRYGLNVHANTWGTFLEDYPDVMGLEAAFNAYKEIAGKDESVCRKLPNFEKHTCDQMFYISFANSFCGYYTKKGAKNKLETSVHSIDSVRVNGAVAQIESFGKAFNCPVESPMNPQKKVNLWQ